MALITKSIKGTQDVLPGDSHKIQFLESSAKEIAANFGFREIRTPVFEHTELFQRGVGDTTDVVQKEMYTFLDKGGRSITLRPEGTAGAVRSFLEHGLYNEPMPQKLCYVTSCYRYEKPQAGRLREFHQFGVECLGTASPAADAEVIAIANELFSFLAVRGLELQINSIGCKECRKEYHKALHDYFYGHKDELCGTCQERLDRNPMRILDCKSPVCSAIAKDAPKVLDYYTRTVFEFVSTDIGAQGTVCGGGRYDGLVEEIGGPHTPALGFGMGLERLQLLMEAQGLPFPEPERCNLYVASMGDRALQRAAQIVSSLRQEGVYAEFDVVGRSVKAQMKYANKIGAKFTMVLGDSELDGGKAMLKNMETGEQSEMSLDTFEGDFMRLSISESLKEIEALGVDTDIDINAIMNTNLF